MQTTKPETENKEVRPKEEFIPPPPLQFNLYNLTVLRKHFHRLGNKAKRDFVFAPDQKKPQLRKDRDFFLSIANYLDIADHIQMDEL